MVFICLSGVGLPISVIVDIEDVDRVVVRKFNCDEHGITMDQEGVNGGMCTD